MHEVRLLIPTKFWNHFQMDASKTMLLVHHPVFINIDLDADFDVTDITPNYMTIRSKKLKCEFDLQGNTIHIIIL